MSATLSAQDLRLLIERVFQPAADDKGLAIIVDLPDERLADNENWSGRRAGKWDLAMTRCSSPMGMTRHLEKCRQAKNMVGRPGLGSGRGVPLQLR